MEANQLLISTLSVVGSLVGAFFGVRIAIARLETRTSHIEKELDKIDIRLSRIEQTHFK